MEKGMSGLCQYQVASFIFDLFFSIPVVYLRYILVTLLYPWREEAILLIFDSKFGKKAAFFLHWKLKFKKVQKHYIFMKLYGIQLYDGGLLIAIKYQKLC